jgi:hypothetical protein
MGEKPATCEEETSSSSSGTMMLLDEQTICNEQVAHQRICNSQIREKGEAGVLDQGIVFDEHNCPRDIRPGQGILRNDPVPTSGRSWDRRGDTPRDQRQAEASLEDRLVECQVAEEMATMTVDHHTLKMKRMVVAKHCLMKKKEHSLKQEQCLVEETRGISLMQ